MSRGPTIRPEEIKRAHELKAEGHKVEQIAEMMKRSHPTVRKMLKLAIPDEQPSA